MVQENPVFPFFVGSGRSGTTLIQSIFDSHSRLAVTHEAHFVVPMARQRRRYERREGFSRAKFVSDLCANGKFRSLGIAPTDVAEALAEAESVADATRAVFATYAASRGKALYGDKTPHFVKHVDLIAQLLPESRFVHIVRDGRDAALGFLEREFGPGSLVDAALYWKGNVDKGRAAGARLGPSRFIEVRYEDLIEDTESTVSRVCRFLGLEFEPAMLRYYERVDSILADHPDPTIHEHLHHPPTKGLRNWRTAMADHDIALFNTVAGGTLLATGYEVSTGRPSLSLRLEVARHWLGWQRQRASAAAKRFRHI